MEGKCFIVIEGIHKDPNNIESIEYKTKKTYGPFDEFKIADNLAKSLIQKNVDNFYHRAWVVKKNDSLDNICEECKKEDRSVKQNLMMHSYKICNSCNISKTIFPI
jgi:hypothetical protein|tara:strand:- start:658 stop:975 length:318 start_codon:yes stop_codon:yes gene_type:complete